MLDVLLQQYLPFTVLKRVLVQTETERIFMLQQYLPFTVLKLQSFVANIILTNVATVLTVYGIETHRE